jgi:hypothetical protein
MLVRLTLIGYGTVIISFMKLERVVTQERFETTIGKHSLSRSRFKNKRFSVYINSLSLKELERE